mgnify:CR=1 FL=1
MTEHRRTDFAMMQTAAGYPSIWDMNTDYALSTTETNRLRYLANQVADISSKPEMSKMAASWIKHNDLKSDIPLVFIDPEMGWNEIVTPYSLLCSDPLARVWEMFLLKQIYWAEKMRDDKVIENTFDVPYVYFDTGWGVPLQKRGGEEIGTSYIVKQAIEDYETDFKKIRYPKIVIDPDQSEKVLSLAHYVFDGILAVRRKATWWWTLGMTWDYINLRGLEDFMCDFLAEPEWVHRMMNLLCDGVIERLEEFERKGLLPDNTGGTYVGSGGFGYTDQLNPKAGAVKLKDMWGFVESQETTAINPDMYGEFILPYHKKIAEHFGLNCYGCCEPFNPRWKYVRQLPRLRRVSVSPFSDWSTVPELLGKEYIASIKPIPTPLASYNMDEEVVRRDCRLAVEQTKGAICEFIMKDNHTLGNNPQNAVRWVEIMREEIERAY